MRLCGVEFRSSQNQQLDLRVEAESPRAACLESEKQSELSHLHNCVACRNNSLQINRIPQVLHLLDGAHLFGVFLADVFIDCQHALADERLRHHRHIAEVVRHEEHTDDGPLRVQQRGLDCPIAGN